MVSADCLCQHTVNVDFLSFDRDLQIESLKQDLELLRAELERVKAEVCALLSAGVMIELELFTRYFVIVVILKPC